MRKKPHARIRQHNIPCSADMCVCVCAHTYIERARNRQVIRIRGNVLCSVVCVCVCDVIILSFHLLALLAGVGAGLKIIIKQNKIKNNRVYVCFCALG